MDDQWWWALGLLVPVGFLTFLFVVSLVERRLVDPYVQIDPGQSPVAQGFGVGKGLPHASQASDYTMRMASDAGAAGLTLEAVYAHAKVPMIKIVGMVLWSADRRVLLSTGSGTVANLPAYQTWLFTPLRDGRYLVTTDNNDEGDHSRLYLTKRVLNVPFEKLHRAHLARVADHGSQATAFAEPSAFEALSGIARQRAERMAFLGIARYADLQRTAWRYTVAGALRVVLDFFKQFGNALTQAWRVNRKPAAASTALRPVGHWQFERAPVDEGGVARE